jgi:hypothetical protein
MLPQSLRKPDRTGVPRRYEAPLVLADARGDTVRSLGKIPLGEDRPLGRVTQFVVADDRLYVGTADSDYVDAYTLHGTRAAVLWVGVAARTPTPRNYDRAIERLVSGLSARADREAATRYLRKIPMPARLPAYTALFADPEGVLWVQTSAPGDSVTRLRALSPEGGLLGDVEVTAEMNILEIGRTYILGAYRTAAGEAHLAVYRVHPAAEVSSVVRATTPP